MMMYRLVLTIASMTKYVHCSSQGIMMVILGMYSVRTSMSEYMQGVRFPDGAPTTGSEEAATTWIMTSQ